MSSARTRRPAALGATESSYTGTASDSKRSQTNAAAKVASLQQLWNYDERVSPWRGTAYGVLAAVNTYTHHEQPVRGADRATRNTERVVFGKVDALDRHTLDVLATV